MDIRGQRRSSNIEDRRGMSPVRKGVGLSLGGILFLVVLSFLGINPLPFLGVATQQAPVEMQPSSQPYQESASEAQLSELAGVTLAQTEETWGKLFDGKYPPPTMVMFTGQTPSACGTGQSAMGPFYCPLDQKVYLDLSFFEELDRKFGAPGDFAQAYVIAHEVGHHVQNLTGTAQQVQKLQQRARDKAEANQYSVMLELQADCYAGVWARDAAPRLNITQQDIEEGLREVAGRAEPFLQLAEERQVEVDLLVRRTVKRAGRRLAHAAGGRVPAGEQHQLRLLVAAAGLAEDRPPGVLGVGEHHRDEAADVVGRLARRLRGRLHLRRRAAFEAAEHANHHPRVDAEEVRRHQRHHDRADAEPATTDADAAGRARAALAAAVFHVVAFATVSAHGCSPSLGYSPSVW
jgi:hypothetical protein